METTETSACPQCVEVVEKAQKCIRAHPEEAAITSLCAGILLAQLPLRLLISGLVRLVLVILKPTIMLYGLYRLVEDCCARRGCSGEGIEI